MWLLNRKVRAFSLMEILVVMVLSSIVVGAVYLTYFTVSTYQLNLYKKQQRAESLSTLYFVLKKDMERSDMVVADVDQNLQFVSIDSVQGLRYLFLDKYVLRQQDERLDTFYGNFVKPVLYWQSKGLTTFPGPVDELEFQVKESDRMLNFRIVKYYDAASLLQIAPTDSLP